MVFYSQKQRRSRKRLETVGIEPTSATPRDSPDTSPATVPQGWCRGLWPPSVLEVFARPDRVTFFGACYAWFTQKRVRLLPFHAPGARDGSRTPRSRREAIREVDVVVGNCHVVPCKAGPTPATPACPSVPRRNHGVPKTTREWRMRDSNPPPSECHSDALPDELIPQDGAPSGYRSQYLLHVEQAPYLLAQGAKLR